MEQLQMIWGWQPALYLFLGGMGAGAFIAAAVLFFKEREGNERLIGASVLAATISLIVGLLLLLSELITPLRGLMMWQSFSNFASWMALGAWIVFLAVVLFALTALCVVEPIAAVIAKVWKSFAQKRFAIVRVLFIVGSVFALGVAVYTGVLLMSAPGVPLWNTLLLPCLFTVSALDTGIALVEVLALTAGKKHPLSHGMTRLFETCVVGLVVLETLVLVVLLVTAGGGMAPADAAAAGASASVLVSGELALPFWVLVVALGLIFPLVVALVSLKQGGADASTRKGSVMAIGAGGALIGGCALRFLVLMAGFHADPVMDVMAKLMGA